MRKRKIKINYKLWNTKKQEWVFIGDSGIRWTLLPDGSVMDLNWNEIHSEIIPIFYTGINDKNGTPVYEDDILDFEPKEWGCEFSSVVTWDKREAAWNFGGGTTDDVPVYRTVVGNKYKYPELDEE